MTFGKLGARGGFGSLGVLGRSSKGAVPTAPVLAITSPSTQANPAFTIDIDNTVAAGDAIDLQVQATGGNWSSLVSDTNHTITSGEDSANEVDLSLSALSNATYDARCNVTHSAKVSSWSNVVTFLIAAAIPAGSLLSAGNAIVSNSNNLTSV